MDDKLNDAARLPSLLRRFFKRAANSDPDAKDEYTLLGESGLFDEGWYLERNPTVASAPGLALRHYIDLGASLKLAPHPLFDPLWYEQQMANQTAENATPLAHYLTVGWQRNLSPHPLFDPIYYQRKLGPGEPASENPLKYFVSKGYKTDEMPHPLFDARFYFEQSPDLAGRDINPLTHFVAVGHKNGTRPNRFFDTEWYRQENRKIIKTHENPLLHFMLAGASLKLNPHPDIDLAEYTRDHHLSPDDWIGCYVHLLEAARKGAEVRRIAASPQPTVRTALPSRLRQAPATATVAHPIAKVAFVGQSEYFRCHYEDDLRDTYLVFEKQLMWGASDSFYDDLIAFDPDLTFVFRGELLPIETLARLGGRKVAISSEPFPKYIDGTAAFTNDSLDRFLFFIENFRPEAYDFVLHYDPISQSFLRDVGLHFSECMPLPIAAEVYTPIDKPRKRDVLFLGRSSAHREELLGLLKRDYDVLHLAHGWPSEHRERSVARDLLPMVSNFKVVLNIHAEDEISWEPRVQQMMACGALVVSEPISKNEIIQPNIHFIEFRGKQNLYDITTEILADPGRFEDIRRAGLRAIQENLAAKSWWTRLIKRLTDGSLPRHEFNYRPLRVKQLKASLQLRGFEHLIKEISDANA